MKNVWNKFLGSLSFFSKASESDDKEVNDLVDAAVEKVQKDAGTDEKSSPESYARRVFHSTKENAKHVASHIINKARMQAKELVGMTLINSDNIDAAAKEEQQFASKDTEMARERTQKLFENFINGLNEIKEQI